jgi:hypothetical protein
MALKRCMTAFSHKHCHVRFVVNAGVGCGAMHAEQTEDTGANMSNSQLEAAARAQHLERENAGLKQQLEGLESRCQQVRPIQSARCLLTNAMASGSVLQASCSPYRPLQSSCGIVQAMNHLLKPALLCSGLNSFSCLALVLF